MNEPYCAILSIVNRGFTDLVMEAAKSAGARGGSVLTGRVTRAARSASRRPFAA